MALPMKFDESPPIGLEGGGYTCKQMFDSRRRRITFDGQQISGDHKSSL